MVRDRLTLACAVLAVVAACVPPPTTRPRHLTSAEIDAIPNVFPVTFVPPRTAMIRPMLARMIELKNPELVGQLVSTLISLEGRGTVPIIVAECDEVTAQYDPRQRRITICYEFIADANRLTGKPKDQWWTLDRDAASLLIFTALHEIGHALVDVLDLRVDGNEEDLVDQFAFLLMTNINDVELVRRLVRSPAAFFYEHGREAERHGGHAPDDVHSSSTDRAFEALCLFYGRHPDPQLAESLGRAAPRCVQHAADVAALWNRLLEPHTRIDSGRTF